MQPIWTPAWQSWSHNPRMKIKFAHFLSLVTRSVEPEANMMAQCGTDTLLLIGSQSCWLSMQHCKCYCYIQQRNMRHVKCFYHISASWAWQCVCLSCCCLVTEQKVRRCEIKVKFWSDPSLIPKLLYQTQQIVQKWHVWGNSVFVSWECWRKWGKGALQIRKKYVTLSSSLWAKSQETRADLSHCPTQKALCWWYAREWWIFMSKKQELWCLFGCHCGNDLLVLRHTGSSADFTHLAQHFFFFTSRLHYIYLLDSFLWLDQAELIFINYSHSQTITCLSTGVFHISC